MSPRRAAMTDAQIRSVDRTLAVGSWAITVGAVLYSVLTVTPLVRTVSPPGWQWTAPILPLVVDAAVVIVVRLDAAVSRLGTDAGRWPAVLRWMTGLMTLSLNVGRSALNGDRVGVAVHAVAPLLLIVTAEAARAYRRTIAAALARIAREEAEQAERERAAEQAREHAARAERERAAQAGREQAEREREHAAALEREAREHAARMAREEREHADRIRREQQDRDDARRREERQRREERERDERQRREHHALTRTRETTRDLHVPGAAEPSGTEMPAKLSEADARAAALAGVNAGRTVRQVAEVTGWSVGWVAARFREARGEVREQTDPESIPA